MELYDEMLSAVLVNLYSVSKNEQKIKIRDMQLSNTPTETQRVVLEVATILHTLFNYQIYLDYNIFQYVLFKLTHIRTWKRWRRFNGKKDNHGISYIKLLEDVSEAYKQKYGIWSEIYNEYYRSK